MGIKVDKIYRNTTGIGFSASSDAAAFTKLCEMTERGEVPCGKWVIRRVRYNKNGVGYYARKGFRFSGWVIICGKMIRKI